jgi:hypothetical protein
MQEFRLGLLSQIDEESGACLVGSLLSRAASTACIFDSDHATKVMAALIAETSLPCPVFFSRLAATIATSPILPADFGHVLGPATPHDSGPEPYSPATLASVLQACTMALKHRNVGMVPGLTRNVKAIMKEVEARLNRSFNEGVKPDMQTALKVVQAYYLQQVRLAGRRLPPEWRCEIGVSLLVHEEALVPTRGDTRAPPGG